MRLAAFFLLFYALPARAQVSVAAPACEGLDVSAIEAALAVEIGDVAAAWRELAAPVVLLGCAEGRVRIEITDPVTDKSVARVVAMPEIDRERVLGLAIAQLFLTSWLELLLEPAGATPGPGAEAAEEHARDAIAAADPEPTPEPTPELAPDPVPEPEADVVAPPPPPAAPGPRVDGEVTIEGGARWRAAGENVATAVGVLRGLVIVDRLLLVGARAGIEWGRAERLRGAIDLYTLAVGIFAGLRSPEVGPFSVEGTLGASLAFVLLEGRPRSVDVEGGATRAIAAELFVEVAPTLRVGPLLLALPLTFSGLALSPDGQVTGEPPVVTAGPALAAALRVGVTPAFW